MIRMGSKIYISTKKLKLAENGKKPRATNAKDGWNEPFLGKLSNKISQKIETKQQNSTKVAKVTANMSN